MKYLQKRFSKEIVLNMNQETKSPTECHAVLRNFVTETELTLRGKAAQIFDQLNSMVDSLNQIGKICAVSEDAAKKEDKASEFVNAKMAMAESKNNNAKMELPRTKGKPCSQEE